MDKRIEELKNLVFENETIHNVTRLGGMTNTTFAVELNSGHYVFRFPTEMSKHIINRKDEKVSLTLACELGLDSEILFFDEETGVKISRYIKDAITMNTESMKKDENINLIAQTFKKLHTCKKDTHIMFDFLNTANQYESFILKKNIKLFDDYFESKEIIMQFRNTLYKNNISFVPCHNDPLCENWVKSKNEMYLIDWEYAGMNDFMWDLACVSIESGYNNIEDDALLSYYFEHLPNEHELQKFTINKVMVDFLWSLWGKTKVPFDGQEFENYANERYNRMKLNLKQLVKER